MSSKIKIIHDKHTIERALSLFQEFRLGDDYDKTSKLSLYIAINKFDNDKFDEAYTRFQLSYEEKLTLFMFAATVNNTYVAKYLFNSIDCNVDAIDNALKCAVAENNIELLEYYAQNSNKHVIKKIFSYIFYYGNFKLFRMFEKQYSEEAKETFKANMDEGWLLSIEGEYNSNPDNYVNLLKHCLSKYNYFMRHIQLFVFEIIILKGDFEILRYLLKTMRYKILKEDLEYLILNYIHVGEFDDTDRKETSMWYLISTYTFDYDGEILYTFLLNSIEHERISLITTLLFEGTKITDPLYLCNYALHFNKYKAYDLLVNDFLNKGLITKLDLCKSFYQ